MPRAACGALFGIRQTRQVSHALLSVRVWVFVHECTSCVSARGRTQHQRSVHAHWNMHYIFDRVICWIYSWARRRGNAFRDRQCVGCSQVQLDKNQPINTTATPPPIRPSSAAPEESVIICSSCRRIKIHAMRRTDGCLMMLRWRIRMGRACNCAPSVCDMCITELSNAIWWRFVMMTAADCPPNDVRRRSIRWESIHESMIACVGFLI